MVEGFWDAPKNGLNKARNHGLCDVAVEREAGPFGEAAVTTDLSLVADATVG
jgi:hypothetical protein